MPPAALALAVLCLAAPRADVLGELETVRALGARGAWQRAADELDRLLERAAGRPDGPAELAPHAREVVSLYERAAFFAQGGEPRPEEVLAGRLVSWDPASRRIALLYAGTDLDFVGVDGALRHPARFTGPYRVEVRGRLPLEPDRERPACPQVLVCIEGADSHQVVFGAPPWRTAEGAQRSVPGALLHNTAGEHRELDRRDDTPLRRGRDYAVAVEVGAARIATSVGGAPFVSAAKPRDLFGRFALLGCPDVTRVAVSGPIDPTWLEQRVARERERRLAEFRAGWDPARRVPAWLLELLPRENTGGSTQVSFALGSEARAVFARVSELRAQGDTRAAGELLASDSARVLPPAVREVLLGLVLLDDDAPRPACEAFERATALDPALAEARALRVRALGRLGVAEPVVAAVEELLAASPALPLAWTECAAALLAVGEPLRARDVVQGALARGIEDESLRRIESLLLRALAGPPWERTEAFASAHYDVRTDGDRRSAFEAATALEETLRFYERRLGRLGRAASRRRYTVLLFTGRSSYDAFTSDLFEGAPESTAGLYSPMLKALLLWSQDEREDTLRTLRHEGLHQFLDGRLASPPPWLDEGLAEYFEVVERARGTVVEGALQEHHVALLAAPGYEWLPYERLLARSHAEFYADAARSYAQSWALIHWLLRSGLAEERVFQSLLDELARGGGADSARARLLAVPDLDTRVRLHLRQD